MTVPLAEDPRDQADPGARGLVVQDGGDEARERQGAQGELAAAHGAHQEGRGVRREAPRGGGGGARARERRRRARVLEAPARREARDARARVQGGKEKLNDVITGTYAFSKVPGEDIKARMELSDALKQAVAAGPGGAAERGRAEEPVAVRRRARRRAAAPAGGVRGGDAAHAERGGRRAPRRRRARGRGAAPQRAAGQRHGRRRAGAARAEREQRRAHRVALCAGGGPHAPRHRARERR